MRCSSAYALQENRPTTMYYGMHAGVRGGFADRTVIQLPTGRPVWYQPSWTAPDAPMPGPQPDGSRIKAEASSDYYILPFHAPFNTTSGASPAATISHLSHTAGQAVCHCSSLLLPPAAVCMDAPEMNYLCDVAMLNDGRFDSWNLARDPGFGMAYFTRDDLPYYYALVDGFVIGDAYQQVRLATLLHAAGNCASPHPRASPAASQATLTQTNPNRLHLFSGSNGLSAGQVPILDNTEPTPGFNWTTVAEVLEAANISWRVLQQTDNFDDNGFAWFQTFQNAAPGSPWYEKGMTTVPDLVAAFDAMLADPATMPQVTYIVGPANLSEHASYHPSAGEDLSARLIKTLAAHPDTYANTAFLLMYDEQGGWFDSQPPYTPPTGPTDGASTVDVSGDVFLGLPIGPGFRVPFIAVSPWSRGPITVSQAFEHTSILRFIEARWDVRFDTISAYRRAIFGDLTSAFNFSAPDYSWPPLPDTSSYPAQSNTECDTLPPPVIPANQSLPVAEAGSRIARALPYANTVSDTLVTANASLMLTIDNDGASGCPFLLYDDAVPSNAPLKFAVSAGTSITYAVPLNASAAGGFFCRTLHAPNGFVRQMNGSVTGSPGDAVPGVVMSYVPASDSVTFTLSNTAAAGSTTAAFTIVDNVYGLGGPWTASVAAGAPPQTVTISIAASSHWYDFTVTIASDAAFGRRLMGHMETGMDSMTDPATASGRPLAPLHPFPEPAQHPQRLPHHRISRNQGGRPDSVAVSAGTGEVVNKDALAEPYLSAWLQARA